MNNKRTKQRILCGILLIALLYLIFGASSQDGETSGSLSAWITQTANAALAALGLPLQISHHFVRKAAHFSEYAVLGALALLNLRAWLAAWRAQLGWALFFGLFTAVLDEFFQTFVPGRAGVVADVLIDFAGVSVGTLIAALIVWKRPLHSGKTEADQGE